MKPINNLVCHSPPVPHNQSLPAGASAQLPINKAATTVQLLVLQPDAALATRKKTPATLTEAAPCVGIADASPR
ncbi:hypothetical protein [Endozoicomonas sp. YOMI1]|uniref:hypothetical protein n=1 Tax=Endozoicomonas sp. YOMI1 TaxID=2828739 RepID=UPI002147BF51|nr:hypothetical protein [Endozoicomonas sp. YOMI1]